ncbi:MAG: hypothetical protein FWD87_11025 [Spirochaetaceae bacterium]|nr:hypothetical protein [Spirochaetaceae bacterium]
MEIIAQSNQSLFDIALMVSGSAGAAFDIALENGISLTDDLMSGQVLKFTGVPVNKRVVDYYAVNSIRPATGLIGYEEDLFGVFDDTFDDTFWGDGESSCIFDETFDEFFE